MQLGEQKRNGGLGHGGVIQPCRVGPAGGGIAHDLEQVVHPGKGNLHQADAWREGLREIIGTAVEDEHLGLLQRGTLVAGGIEGLQGFFPRGGHHRVLH